MKFCIVLFLKNPTAFYKRYSLKYNQIYNSLK